MVRAIVVGRVQGVGFRAWTRAQAVAPGLRGFVRNRRSGDVEAVIAGPAASVETLCGLLRCGPPEALVERVEVTEADAGDLAAGGAPDFRQIATI
jgi:acylphosphatase